MNLKARKNDVELVRSAVPDHLIEEWDRIARDALKGAAQHDRQINKVEAIADARRKMMSERNRQIAREYKRRRNDPQYLGLSASDLMELVGELPQFDLSRSAAIRAIRSGLKILT